MKIDVFTTINNIHKKIAPGSSGSFVIKFKRLANANYKIKINEITSKPQNLVFMLENKKFTSLKEMEEIINTRFSNTEKVTIHWEWKYHIDNTQDIQDTKDSEKTQKYLFEIEAIVIE